LGTTGHAAGGDASAENRGGVVAGPLLFNGSAKKYLILVRRGLFHKIDAPGK
jgi:hypothetical protein